MVQHRISIQQRRNSIVKVVTVPIKLDWVDEVSYWQPKYKHKTYYTYYSNSTIWYFGNFILFYNAKITSHFLPKWYDFTDK